MSIESRTAVHPHGQRAAAVARTGMADGDQHVAARDRHALRSVSDLELPDDLVRARVDARQGSAELVRHPHAPGHRSDRAGTVPGRDESRLRVRLRVDTRHGPVETVRDPDAPSPDAIPVGPLPTPIAVWSPVSGSMRTTRFAPRWLAQRVPSRKARSVAGICNVFSGLPESASIRVMVPSPCSRPRSSRPPKAMPTGPLPTSIGWTTVFVPGSIRETVPSRLLVTQTAPFPIAIPLGLLPTRDRLDDALGRGVDPRNAVAVGVRDPDGAAPDRDGGRARPYARVPDEHGLSPSRGRPPNRGRLPRPIPLRHPGRRRRWGSPRPPRSRRPARRRGSPAGGGVVPARPSPPTAVGSRSGARRCRAGTVARAGRCP